MSFKLRRRTGFTIVELLIVVVVIAVLASISMVAYSGIQARARDSIRKSDLSDIKKALNLYYTDRGNWIEAGSGCGYNGGGYGWFNSSGGSYPASTVSCLVDAGYIDKEIIDPTGGRSSSPTSGFTYMKYQCGSGSTFRVYVYAKLETEPQSTTATDGTCQATVDSLYGMNYYLQVN